MVFNVAAELRLPDGAAPLACTVRDVSKSGARLEIDPAVGRRAQPDVILPEKVEIYFCTESRLVPCQVRWQDGRHFGVAYIFTEGADELDAPGTVTG
jgi:hypothetical protein